ncbi:MAG: putative sulfate exporter family transporter [SAR86 cluster bacterium]|uniref:Putative sulfate exporter family transporter n=1 Tax=SAR86 cluster bacterium TaxID=2030880 RepID=A0A368BK56_9GAMM|nr:MAG: putative sulfate exporter family transporter [SAR86 cluster bacterium]
MINFIFALIVLMAILAGNAALSIFLGIAFTFFFKPSSIFLSRRLGTIPLQIGIVILGATISLPYAVNVSSVYLPWISLFVILSFFAGLIIGKILKIENRLAFLISSGAAICGGTAMAAIAPIIKAKPQELLIALTIVFLLNAIAIILFPIAGNYLEMSDFEFGAWSALAIHDTSSVIGAASIYSNESAQVAATLKLGRTIWLIPLILLTNWVFNKNLQAAQFPRFIIFFILAILVNTFFNFDEITLSVLQIISQSFLMFGLFCIGSQFDSDQLTSISSKPLILALLLWMAVLPWAYFLVKYF